MCIYNYCIGIAEIPFVSSTYFRNKQSYYAYRMFHLYNEINNKVTFLKVIKKTFKIYYINYRFCCTLPPEN